MIYQFLSRYGQYFGLGLGLLIVILYFALVGMKSGEFSPLIEEKDWTGAANTGAFNIGIFGAFALTVLGAIAIFLFSILGIVMDIKGSLKGLIGIGALLLIFLICYFMSNPATDADFVIDAQTRFDVSNSSSKFISGSLWTTAALLGAACIGLIASEVMNFFR